MNNQTKLKKKIADDIATADTVRQSIQDLRRIYSEMSDDEFVRWYFRKYKVPMDTVRRVLGI